MGYTHYWNQAKDFTKDEWAQVSTDLTALLSDVMHVQNIALADGSGDPGTQPEFTSDRIAFNGVGADHYETFSVERVRGKKETWERFRGSNFCKTAHKPYDLAVTAVLCYLATVAKTHTVTSDGHGKDWIEGLAEAKRALPQYGNVLDIPMDVLKNDRWVGPWMHAHTDLYRFVFCVDGHAYIIRIKDGASYQFATHDEGNAFFTKHKAVLDATGSFDAARIAKLKRQQNALLGKMIDATDAFYPERAVKPPAFVRPMQFPAFEEKRWASLTALIEGVN